ncbi:hypothetical protein PG279_07495 [Riemerella anatipestifer]|nr:hypothetical protein [Riemerella anatipestifer]
MDFVTQLITVIILLTILYFHEKYKKNRKKRPILKNKEDILKAMNSCLVLYITIWQRIKKDLMNSGRLSGAFIWSFDERIIRFEISQKMASGYFDDIIIHSLKSKENESDIKYLSLILFALSNLNLSQSKYTNSEKEIVLYFIIDNIIKPLMDGTFILNPSPDEFKKILFAIIKSIDKTYNPLIVNKTLKTKQ